MLSPKGKRRLNQIIPFGVIWFSFCVIYMMLEQGILGDHPVYPSTGNAYNFQQNLFLTTALATLSGLLVGTLEVLYLNRLFAHVSFAKKITYKTLIYIVLLFFVLVINVSINDAIEFQTHFFDPLIWERVSQFLSSFAFWSIELYIASITIISLFYLEVSDNVGQHVLLNIFTGKYHHPLEEERIFLFVDMNDSTSIAEQIGHLRYFEMLKRYYTDLSDSIIQYGGDIDQYVGDEVIISWSLKNGLRNNNCLRCFFAMKEALAKQANPYKREFGLLPSFKAGLHLGKVTVGEIGVIKKSITFSGDVLNTTARLQGLCSTFRVDLLLSQQILDRLSIGKDYQVMALGEAALRGRDEKVEIYTVQPNE